MRDPKSLLFLLFALFVITISFILISVWGYHFYYGDKNEKPVEQIVANPVTVNPIATRDSLRTLYNATIQKLNFKPDSMSNHSDSLTRNLHNNIVQYNTLKSEVAGILKNKISAADMAIAQEKIIELQKKVDELSNKTNELAAENIRLNSLVKQLISERSNPNADSKKTIPQSNRKGICSLKISKIDLEAISTNNGVEKLTSTASKADKLIGLFYTKNTSRQSDSAEIEIEILQPNEEVLQNSAWESGDFETASGKKVYTKKLLFDISKRENKRVEFSLNVSLLQKGIYRMHIYYNGVIVGRRIKTLY